MEIIYCVFGCGSPATYQFKNGKHCCSKASSSCPSQKKKNSKSHEGFVFSDLAKENAKEARKLAGPWNKGLTKETDTRVKLMSNIISEKMTIAWQDGTRVCSDEQRLAHSESAKKKNLGGYNPRGGRGKKGWFANIWCDSSWELAWVIYALDHDIGFEKNTEKFEYLFESKRYNYIPDFKLNDGTYIEIKGYETARVKEKIAYFPHKIKVINKDDIKLFIAYAVEKFGKDFIKQYTGGLPELV